MQIRYIPPPPGNSNPVQKALAVIATAALVTVGLMFSAVLFAVLLVVVALGGVWLWWRTREVRRQLRLMQQALQEAQARSAAGERETFRGEVIEGEAVRVDNKRDAPG
jgi:uncharacterized protein HemX